jgi:membrane-associated phospholipid phosphatase
MKPQESLMRRWWIALGSLAAFCALAVCVHLGLLQTFDATVRQWMRPDGAWGTTQEWADLVVHALRPELVSGLLVALSAGYCVKRRSLRPLVFVGGVGLLTVALTIGTKGLMARPDPHGLVVHSNGGSFPSGHTVAVMVCLGVAVLLAHPRAGRWVWLIPAAGGGLVGAAMLLQAAHWSTDVVGGALLATGVLAVVIALGWSRWLHQQRRNDNADRLADGSHLPTRA